MLHYFHDLALRIEEVEVATVSSREIVDVVIAGNGYYPGDRERVVKIVEYQNMFDGGTAWGLVYESEDRFRYESSPAVVNPRTIWVAEEYL